MKRVKAEYEKFMKEMQSGFEDVSGEDFDLKNMGSALGDLIKGLAGEEGENLSDDFGKKFSEMFQNFDSGENIESAAEKLL